MHWTMVEVDPVGLARDGLHDGLVDVTHLCLAESNEIIPLEEGNLEGTGTAEVDGLEGQVGYGTPYAVYQHERTDLRHDPGRYDHYLERTVLENSDRYADMIEAKVRERLGG